MTVSPRVQWAAAWLFATGLIVACARTIDWTRAMSTFASVNMLWIIPAIVANATTLPLWVMFWRSLAPAGAPVPFRRMLSIVATASSLMNTVPFGGGHAASVALLNKRGGISLPASLALMALDQLGEGVVKVGIFLTVALLAPLPPWMRAGVAAASLGVAAWLIALLVASRWRRELQLLHSLRPSFAALAWLISMKIPAFLAIVAVQRAFGLDLTWSSSLLVYAAVVMGSILPIAPGNLGTYEASAFLAYRYLGVGAEQALGLAIMQHIAFMLPAVGVGYLFVSAQAVTRKAVASR